ncbi:hypothetical protein [Fulvimarina sp. MAC8]|uniref:hypothetical protein n=1 Tax=Fulvimarina sp. MAC8 TaxID=3162874 RepID=UPI0032EF28D1
MTSFRSLMAAAFSFGFIAFVPEARGQGCDTAVYQHNGSRMLIHACSSGGITIGYDRPRQGMRAQGVRPGTMLFRGRFWGSGGPNLRRVRGTAHLFKRGCNPAGYEVEGYWMENNTLQIGGWAPVRKNGCRVSGTRMDDLVFTPR